MKTDALIDLLAQDATPRIRISLVFAGALMLGIALATLLFFAELGFRKDIAQAMETRRFVFKFTIMLALAVAATGAVFSLARPGVPAYPWIAALAAVPVLLGLAVTAELFSLPSTAWQPALVGASATVCMKLIPLLSIGPLACLIVALRRGAAENPGRSGALAGLAAGAIGATLYASHCIDDSPLFLMTWYTLSITLMTGAGYVAGLRFLRW